MPLFKLSKDEFLFPSPELAENNGLLAVGGDLSPVRILAAYSLGIFPWFNEGEPVLWWSLNPRLICFPEDARFSKTLLKRIRRKEFEIRIDTNFRQVIDNCASSQRINQEGTWITNEVREAYCKLHDLGFAHSFETYKDGKLAGGLYGLSLGKMFSGESMFYLQTDASKVAFYYLTQFAKMQNFDFIDCQQVSNHLQTLGAKPVKRENFLELLKSAINKETLIGKWNF